LLPALLALVEVVFALLLLPLLPQPAARSATTTAAAIKRTAERFT
jgi:hypothetical protein